MQITIRLIGFAPLVRDFESMTIRSLNPLRRNQWASNRLQEYVMGRFKIQQNVKSGFRDFRAGQVALSDTGELRRSFKPFYDITTSGTGTEHVRGTHDSIIPRRISTTKNRGYLSIPLSPPLSASQARTYNNSRVPGGFVLYKGPEGPGVYTASKVGSSAKKARGANLNPQKKPATAITATKTRGPRKPNAWDDGKIHRVKAFVKGSLMPQRLLAYPEPVWIQYIGDGWLSYITTGRFT